MFEIRKDIPLWHNERVGGRKAIYPWNKLEVGDSFFVPNIPVKRVSSAASAAARSRSGVKYAVRTENDGARVWRVA